MSAITNLILTSSDSGAGGLQGARLADCVIAFGQRFVWGQLPSTLELETFLSPRSAMHEDSGSHWLDHLTRKRPEEARQGLGFVEFCKRFEAVELWIDPDPNAQLQMIWLLDHLRPHANVTSRLALVQSDTQIGAHSPQELPKGRLQAVPICNDHLETASVAWRAYREPTPQAWCDLLSQDLSVLPQLRQTVLELLEELPMDATGLGATEMRMLELISVGGTRPFDVFPGRGKLNERRVFGYWEVGLLLDGLARATAPAVSDLEEGPFTIEMHENPHRHEQYRQSNLKLTALGQAVLARTEDFSRHNPVRRWWGGCELINDRLWRWNPQNHALVAP